MNSCVEYIVYTILLLCVYLKAECQEKMANYTVKTHMGAAYLQNDLYFCLLSPDVYTSLPDSRAKLVT